MKPRLTLRHLILGGALVLTLVSVVLVNRMEDPQPVASQVARSNAPERAPTAAGPVLGAARVEAARKQPVTKPAANVFAPTSFYVPPPKPVALPPPPPPPPTAPPLPFKYMGRYTEGKGTPVLFLTSGERLYSVHVGDVIDDTYRVEKLTPTELIFIYLPMDERQVLPIAEAS